MPCAGERSLSCGPAVRSDCSFLAQIELGVDRKQVHLTVQYPCPACPASPPATAPPMPTTKGRQPGAPLQEPSVCTSSSTLLVCYFPIVTTEILTSLDMSVRHTSPSWRAILVGTPTLGLLEYPDAPPQVRAVYDDIMATRHTGAGSTTSGKPWPSIPPPCAASGKASNRSWRLEASGEAETHHVHLNAAPRGEPLSSASSLSL